MQRREKREQREREIVEKSIKLLANRGFLGVRMSDVAQESGFSMGTIYSHFESNLFLPLKKLLLPLCAVG